MRTWTTLLGLAVWTLSQTAQAETMNLRQCIDTALNQSPALMASSARIEQAQAAISQSKNSYLPKITASVTASRSSDPLNIFGMKLMQKKAAFNDFGAGEYMQSVMPVMINPADPNAQAIMDNAGKIKPRGLNKADDYTNINTSLQAEMPLYTGGKLSAYVRQAQAYLSAAQSGDAAARQHLMFMVFQAYEGAHTAQAFVDVAEQGVKAAQSFVNTAENLSNQGILVKSELLTAQVHLSNVKLQREQAENQKNVAMDQLKLLMGMDLSAPLTLANSQEVPPLALDAAQAKTQALDHNAQLVALRKQAESSIAAVDAAKADYYPTVGLMARQDWNDDHLALNNSSYTVAGVASWTLTDFGVTKAAVSMAQANQAELQADVLQQEQEIAFKVSEAQRNLTEAMSRVASLAVNVEQAEEAQHLVTQRHEGGVATSTEVLVAETQLLKAKADLISARHEVNTQRMTLHLLTGELNESLFR